MIVTAEISLRTKGNCDIVDITPQVARHVGKAKITNGTVTVF